MEFSYSQTENFEMEKLSSDTGYFKKPVEINRGWARLQEFIIYYYSENFTYVFSRSIVRTWDLDPRQKSHWQKETVSVYCKVEKQQLQSVQQVQD